MVIYSLASLGAVQCSLGGEGGNARTDRGGCGAVNNCTGPPRRILVCPSTKERHTFFALIDAMPDNLVQYVIKTQYNETNENAGLTSRLFMDANLLVSKSYVYPMV